MSFENGVSYYTRARAVVIVNFPENKTVCQWCPFCKNEDRLRRWKCILTGELIVYPFDFVGNQCPLILEDSKDE